MNLSFIGEKCKLNILDLKGKTQLVHVYCLTASASPRHLNAVLGSNYHQSSVPPI